MLKASGFVTFPKQKVSDNEKLKKDKQWFKDCIDYAEHIVNTDTNVRNTFKNKQSNYNLRSYIIDPKDFEKKINPHKFDLSSLPAEFQHVGVENNKINLLIGEYIKRRKDWKIYLSNNDTESVTQKEKARQAFIKQRVMQSIINNETSEEEVQKILKDLKTYINTEFQDVSEIICNKIIKREYIEQNFDFLFSLTFEDLLVSGEEMVYTGILGKMPVMRRVDPRNLYTLGNNTMYLENSDIIVEYDYKPVGQIIDDYWDVLTEEDQEYLENGDSGVLESSALGLNRDISVYEKFGDDGIQIFSPSELASRSFNGTFDSDGRVRILKVVWKSRRKIGKLKYFDEYGVQQEDYVSEKYTPNKELGEEIEWLWINEWMEGTKIGRDIYVNMRPIRYTGTSAVNKSKSNPPYIGRLAISGTKVISLMDMMKPLTFSFDLAYYKRELSVATHIGSFAAINSAMVPSGWDPKEWIRYATINKFAFLDPTNEILKGPSQGKSAGAYNTITATDVRIDNTAEIQAYTNLMFAIEDTLGKIAGVTGAREGQIQNREAVGNVEREVTQTSHITEKWFNLDSNFRKAALTQFMNVAKYAYYKYPERGEAILNEFGLTVLEFLDILSINEHDLHVADSGDDTKLIDDLKQLAHAAIQAGEATLVDFIDITKSETIQEVSTKLKTSMQEARSRAEEQQKQQQEMQQMQLQQQKEMAEAQEAYNKWKDEKEFALKDRQLDLKYLEIMLENQNKKEDRDLNNNGIDDTVDMSRVKNQMEIHKDKLALENNKLKETIRHNKATENKQPKKGT